MIFEQTGLIKNKINLSVAINGNNTKLKQPSKKYKISFYQIYYKIYKIHQFSLQYFTIMYNVHNNNILNF